MLTWRLGSAVQSQARRARVAGKRKGRMESLVLGEGSGAGLNPFEVFHGGTPEEGGIVNRL